MMLRSIFLLAVKSSDAATPLTAGSCAATSSWSSWYDYDDPSATQDNESLSSIRKRHSEMRTCSVTAVQATLVNNKAATETTQNVKFGLNTDMWGKRDSGLRCSNEENPEGCDDYQVRFCCTENKDVVVPLSAGFCAPSSSWTEWYNRDSPDANEDHEPLSVLKNENPQFKCRITGVQATLVNDKTVTETTQNVKFGLNVEMYGRTDSGLRCKNSENPGGCADYAVRYCCTENVTSLKAGECAPSSSWTKWYDRDDPTAFEDHEPLSEIMKENPRFKCDVTGVEATLVNDKTVTETTQNVKFGLNVDMWGKNDSGLRCKNIENPDGCADYAVRFCCAGTATPLTAGKCAPSSSWTEWYSRDTPDANEDHEPLSKIMEENPQFKCQVTGVQATLVNDKDVTHTSQNVKFGLNVDMFGKKDSGLRCKNSENDGGCLDYAVRFCCRDPLVRITKIKSDYDTVLDELSRTSLSRKQNWVEMIKNKIGRHVSTAVKFYEKVNSKCSYWPVDEEDDNVERYDREDPCKGVQQLATAVARWTNQFAVNCRRASAGPSKKIGSKMQTIGQKIYDKLNC